VPVREGYLARPMDMRPEAIIERFRGKFLRFVTVSVVGTVITWGQLLFYVGSLGWSGAVANVVAVTVASVPAFFLSKHWVWQHDSRSSVHREATAFWGMNLAGLVLSTLFVAVAYAIWPSALTVVGANLAGFGMLWLAKFLVLDEYLFRGKDTEVPIV
jgi:putative flippase GtrA